MHTIISVQDVVYKIFFTLLMHSKFGMHQLAHPMGLVEKLLAIQLFIFFQKSGYDKCHSETYFKTLLS